MKKVQFAAAMAGSFISVASLDGYAQPKKSPNTECTYQVVQTGPLLQGASSQRLDVTSDLPQCVTKLTGTLKLTFGSVTMSVTGSDASKPPPDKTATLQVQNVPENLQSGTNTMYLSSGAESIGKIDVVVAQKLTIADFLAIKYNVSRASDPMGIFERANGKSEGKTALVDPSASAAPGIVNLASLVFPSGLPVDGPLPNHEWRVLTASWGDQVHFLCAAGWQRAGAGCTLNEGPREIKFQVNNAQSTPLTVKLGLFHRTTVEPLLQVDARIADGAGKQSVPMAIRAHIAVYCDRDEYINLNEQTRAVVDDALATHQCVAVFVPSAQAVDAFTNRPTNIGEANWKNQKPQFKEMPVPTMPDPLTSSLYGPQSLVVQVKQDAGEVNSVDWQIADPTQMAFITIPKPKGTASSNVYTVEVAHKAKGNYRGIGQIPVNGDTLDRADLRARVYLRPRGPFGWNKLPVRTYVTIPVQLSGLRFPASGYELKSSTDPTVYQFVSPRVGMLIVVEPWNYDLGRNFSPFGFSVAGGLSLLQASTNPVSVSTLLGVQLQLPLVESPSQLGTSISLGLFWENNLRENGLQANHALLTLGVNVLTLLAPK
jgi:hypothetical protein